MVRSKDIDPYYSELVDLIVDNFKQKYMINFDPDTGEFVSLVLEIEGYRDFLYENGEWREALAEDYDKKILNFDLYFLDKNLVEDFIKVLDKNDGKIALEQAKRYTI